MNEGNTTETHSKPKPFIKWAGGKSRLSGIIKGYFPEKEKFSKYYEPFLGSGALYFEIAPQNGQLNDLNKYLIGTYQSIKDNPTELIKELQKLSELYHSLPSLTEKSELYYKCRDEYNGIKLANIHKSALFIFLNKTGFNGMYRENSAGLYNIPFGKHNKCLICDEENLKLVSQNLKDIELTHGDYSRAIENAQKGDLIYLDPPYFPVNSKRGNFTKYQKDGFDDNNQEELFRIAQELDKKGCFVVISNSYCEKSVDLYSQNKNFSIYNGITVRRIISPYNKKNVKEIVVTNYKVEDKTQYEIREFKPC